MIAASLRKNNHFIGKVYSSVINFKLSNAASALFYYFFNIKISLKTNKTLRDEVFVQKTATAS